MPGCQNFISENLYWQVSSYIVERSADDILVLFWYHRQFIEATKERYLKDPTFSKMIHTTMAEYFLGRWGGGKPKPFQYTEHQKHRFGEYLSMFSFQISGSMGPSGHK